ncbi:MAG: hypothetical protein L0211_22870 [Planctomycetaceae bacterium]|nr:hypothetical protein [Planctomycetaceae bacterium]
MSIVFLASLLLAADPVPAAADTDKARQEEVARLAPAKAKIMEVVVGDEDPAKADLVKEPLLRWSNPTAGSVYGEVFLWTVDRRPAAIASIYRWYHPFKDSTVEFVSVAERGVQAKEGDVSHWNTKTPGTRFADLAGAQPPAESARGRLGQMRSLAREFATELADKRGGDEVVRELRLLDQPAYRYDSPSHKVLDGGLFAFVEGTDPESWLMLEAIESTTGRGWRFALARMNIDALRVRRNDSIVQSWDGLRDAWSDRTRPYVMFNFDPNKLLPGTSPLRQPQSKESPE